MYSTKTILANTNKTEQESIIAIFLLCLIHLEYSAIKLGKCSLYSILSLLVFRGYQSNFILLAKIWQLFLHFLFLKTI